jgi:hypothetical protein
LTTHFAEIPVAVEGWVRGISKLMLEIKVPHEWAEWHNHFAVAVCRGY